MSKKIVSILISILLILLWNIFVLPFFYGGLMGYIATALLVILVLYLLIKTTKPLFTSKKSVILIVIILLLTYLLISVFVNLSFGKQTYHGQVILSLPIDINDVKFFLREKLDPQSIKILSPNGGESWEKGQKVQILWDATKKIEFVNIRLGIRLGEKQSGSANVGWFKAIIASKVPNTGSYEWTVQDLSPDEGWGGIKALPASDRYFLIVEDDYYKSDIDDRSDKAFSIK